jgi:hypothetical protein
MGGAIFYFERRLLLGSFFGPPHTFLYFSSQQIFQRFFGVSEAEY